MDDKKYFRPDISDFHVGYECETTDNAATPNWHHYVYSEYDTLELTDYTHFYRTPYLHREQFEAEGWSNYEYFQNFIYFYRVTLNAFKYQIKYETETHELVITQTDLHGNRGTTQQLFFGECRDINTFRLILKLIKV